MIIGINLKKCQEENKCPENIGEKINQKSWAITVNLKKGKNTVVLSNDNSENFNGKSTSAPYIFNLNVNPLFSEPVCITNTYNTKG